MDDLSSRSSHRKSRIENEISILSSIYLSNLKLIDDTSIRIKIVPNTKNHLCSIKLSIKFPNNYPSGKPEVSIKPYNIEQQFITPLNSEIQDILSQRESEKCESILDICYIIQNLVDKTNNILNHESSSKGSKQEETIKPNVFLERSNNSKSNESKKSDVLKKKNFSHEDKTESIVNRNNRINEFQEFRKLTGNQIPSYNKTSSYIDIENTLIMNNIKNIQNVLSDQKSRFLTDFIILEKLGSGSGGTVYKVKNNLDGLNYAVKMIHLYLNEEETYNISKEVGILARMHHPNIVRYYGAWMESEYEQNYKEFLNKDNRNSIKYCSDEDISIMNKKSSMDNKNFEFIARTRSKSFCDQAQENYKCIKKQSVLQKTESNLDDIIEFNEKEESKKKEDPSENVDRSKKSFKMWGDSDEQSGNDEETPDQSNNNRDESSMMRSHLQDQSRKSDLTNNIVFFDDMFDIKKNIHKISQHEETKKDQSAENSYSQEIEGLKLNKEKQKQMQENISKRDKQAQGNRKIENRKKTIFIQMEYCEKLTLKEVTDGVNKIELNEKWKLIIQILEALAYIHSKHLIHRDLKPTNIFLDKNLHIKLGDFGLVTLLNQKGKAESSTQRKEHIKFGKMGEYLSCGVGTLHYSAPEQETKNIYDEKADMYSLGIIIFELFHKFNSRMERDTVLRKIASKHEFPDLFLSSAPENIIKICKNLTSNQPQVRWSSSDLLTSNLIPTSFNEKVIFSNFSRILEENPSYIPKFIEMITSHKTQEVKAMQFGNKGKDCNLNDKMNSTSSSIRGQEIDNSLSKESIYENTLENTFISLYKSSIKIPSIDIFTLNQKIINKITKLLESYNGSFIPISQINLVQNKVQTIQFSEDISSLDFKISHMSLSKILTPQLITKSGDLVVNDFSLLKNLIKVLDSMNCKIGKFFSFSNPHLNLDCIIDSNKVVESAEIYFISLWQTAFDHKADPRSNKLMSSKENIHSVDYDNNLESMSKQKSIQHIKLNMSPFYENESLQLLFNFLDWLPENSQIQIKINSSFVLDSIIKKNNLKRESLIELLSLLDLYICHVQSSNGSSTQSFKYTKKLRDIHHLLNGYSGDIRTIKTKFDKNSFVYSHLTQIQSLFEPFIKNMRYKHITLKFDPFLIPYGLDFYSGLVFSINVIHGDRLFPILSGGRIDAILNDTISFSDLSDFTNNRDTKTKDNHNECAHSNHGLCLKFSTNHILNFLMEHKSDKDADDRIYKISVLLTTEIEEGREIMTSIANQLRELNISFEILHEVQGNSLDNFNSYYKIFRMRMLFTVKRNLDERVLYIKL